MIISRFSIENSSESKSDKNSESFNNKNDNLNINKNKESLQNMSKKRKNHINYIGSSSEMLSSPHMVINVKKTVEENQTQKRLSSSKNSEQNVNENAIENVNSSIKDKFRFIRFVSNQSISRFINRRYKDSESDSKSIESSYKTDIVCLVCDEKLKEKEKRNNYLECYHYFCDDCYYEYFKEKISNNQIGRIKCLQKDCDTILSSNFIEKILYRDIPLLEQYKNLESRRQLILNPNIQLCPYPNCESYAKKDANTNYVCCIKNKHKFCFNCLKDWHGNKKCDDSVDKSFEKWRVSYKVKRCPKCKYFIEKNFGCNHITCSSCGYQFCWLCLGEYSSGHYEFGRCSGLQYANCNICSNRIINFLYQILLVILKCTAFAILTPFILIFTIYYVFFEKFIDHYNDCGKIFNGISGILCCFNFIVCGFVISSFISVLMIFIWPLQDAIISLVCD